MTTVKTILIAGATGHQGKAACEALAPPSDDPPTFHILALTRNAASETAQHLASSMKHLTVVQGDLDSPESIRKIFEDQKSKGGIWGVFSVLAFPGLGANPDGEERQGKVTIFAGNFPRPRMFSY
jgi:NAD(P)-dependent dehydrogenase (short-subunit alcohol dehydrogenase family)